MAQKPEQINKIRHSLAHVLASVVLDIDKNTKFGIGPIIENGFYYDIQTTNPLSESQLTNIENKMRGLIKKNLAFTQETISPEEAREIFKDQPFKLELIKELAQSGEKISIYRTGNFVDLCSGPHVENTSKIPGDSFKLTKLAGAYWRGSEKNPMLTRIYGVAFENKKELDEYLKLQEEAAKRDHKILGEKLELFTFSEKVGKGLPLWLPKGTFIRRKLEDYMYELEKQNGYQLVMTSHIAKEDLYKQSGHLAHYKDDMYAPIEIEGEKYYLKPMNCPHHHMIFLSKPRSYKELPVRLAEFGTVYRFERSGTLTGLIRTRGFTQNDAHIYCAKAQLKKELVNTLKLFKKVYKDFSISDYYFRLSLPDFSNDEKYGDIENKSLWNFAAEEARQALKDMKMKYVEATGEAAFYGPKIDVQIKNVLGKEDTIATVQVDFFMPERFDLTYTDQEGKKERPIIIHRAIMGSFDRFFSFLIEKYAGHFPLWMAPEQVWVLPIGKQHKKYAKEVYKMLAEENIRVELKDENETIGKKIRQGEQQKIPYILVIGDKEVKSKSVAVRSKGKNKGAVKIKKLIETLKNEIEKKR